MDKLVILCRKLGTVIGTWNPDVMTMLLRKLWLPMYQPSNALIVLRLRIHLTAATCDLRLSSLFHTHDFTWQLRMQHNKPGQLQYRYLVPLKCLVAWAATSYKLHCVGYKIPFRARSFRDDVAPASVISSSHTSSSRGLIFGSRWWCPKIDRE